MLLSDVDGSDVPSRAHDDFEQPTQAEQRGRRQVVGPRRSVLVG